jgi:bifunctional DNA-binding transcriptional regulator/antitoxin component of YhaV-PrlF toxin-antitoxin module
MRIFPSLFIPKKVKVTNASSSKYSLRVTIPKEITSQMGLEAGSEAVWIYNDKKKVAELYTLNGWLEKDKYMTYIDNDERLNELSNARYKIRKASKKKT